MDTLSIISLPADFMPSEVDSFICNSSTYGQSFEENAYFCAIISNKIMKWFLYETKATAH